MTNFWSSIHCLRGIAALLVVLHHIPQYLEKKSTDYPISFELGAIGVDVFFAISGFVMYHTASKQGITPHGFILDRVKRVLPLYWLITIILGSTTLIAPSLFSSFQATPQQIFQSIFFVPIYSETGMIRPILAMGWTLHYEMLFYVCTGLFLFFRTRINAALISTTALALASCTISFANFDYRNSATQTLAPLVIEFCFGAFIAFISKNKKTYTKEGLAFMAAGLLFIFSHPAAYDSIGFDRLFSWGAGAAFLVLGAVVMERNIAFGLSICTKAKEILFKLGDSSYSLYLTHGISFSISYQLYKLTNINNWAFATLILLTNAIIIGHLTHITIEKPISKALKRIKV